MQDVSLFPLVSHLLLISCRQFIDNTSALAWAGPMASEQLLAVGAESGSVRLYDMRSGKWAVHLGTNNSRRVIGIRQDPFNAYCLATFSDCEGEAVKVY